MMAMTPEEDRRIHAEILERQVEFRGAITALMESNEGIRKSLYGADGTGGVVGMSNWFKGFMVFMSIVLTIGVYASWRTGDSIAKVHEEISLHSQETAHPVMEHRYEVILDTIENHMRQFTHAPEAELEEIHRRMHERMRGEELEKRSP